MPTAPPASLSGWQYIAFFAIVSAVTLIQSYFAHKKIDQAVAAVAAKSEEKKS